MASDMWNYHKFLSWGEFYPFLNNMDPSFYSRCCKPILKLLFCWYLNFVLLSFGYNELSLGGMLIFTSLYPGWMGLLLGILDPMLQCKSLPGYACPFSCNLVAGRPEVVRQSRSESVRRERVCEMIPNTCASTFPASGCSLRIREGINKIARLDKFGRRCSDICVQQMPQ